MAIHSFRHCERSETIPLPVIARSEATRQSIGSGLRRFARNDKERRYFIIQGMNMNNKKIKLSFFTAIVILACFGFADKALAVLPTVVTNDADEITSWSARMNGEITYTGGDDNDERGFEWGTASGVYTSWWTETGVFTEGTFSRYSGGLSPGQTYYYRAKSYNSFGWAYGEEKSWTATSYTYLSYDYAYYASGTAVSQNILSGLLVAGITSFDYTATVPTGTTLKVQFSQNGSNWYNSAATAGAWDTCSDGVHNISLTALDWNGPTFYYKLELIADAAQNATPEVDSVGVNYVVPASPTVVTNDAGVITSWSAQMNGEITNTGGADNDERGFEWGTTLGGPYTSWWTETGAFGAGTFSRYSGGLSPGQTYYYRAKSHNAVGWSYGVEKSFTATSYTYPTYDYTYYASGTAVSQNILEGLAVANITSFDYTATVPTGTTLKVQFSQNGSNWYNSAATAGGWNTCSNGIHNISLAALDWNDPTFYYKLELIADAAQNATPEVDSVGVNYVVPASPTVVTNDAGVITSWSAQMNGEITNTGGADNDERGFEWGTTLGGPYTSWWTETGAFGIEAFSRSIGGLSPCQTYYYRAKSLNSYGWGYGAEKSFTAPPYTYPSYDYAYYASGTAVSQNILSGIAVEQILSFDYTATVPADTTLKVQFSQDGTNWYNSAATAGAWDTCSDGVHNISLDTLNWNGPTFYYKLELTADAAQNATPEVDSVGVNYALIPHNTSGWAWSENIGWISMNSINTASAVSYGVELDDNPDSPTYGEFSGYAWSENIGWISFNAADTAGCPIPPCKAVLSTSTLEVSGWARVLSVKDKPLDQTGGWNGWIKLSGSYGADNYGITLDKFTQEFEGWAWGGSYDVADPAVIGWISWNDKDYDGFPGPIDYQVVTTASFTAANQPPTAIISCTSTCGCDTLGCGVPPDICTGYTGCAFVLNNDSTDPNGEADIATSTWYLNGEKKYSYPGKCNITPGNYVGAGNHTSELKVADYAGETSNTTKSFTLLEGIEAGFVCSLNNVDWVACSTTQPLLDEIVYVNDSQPDPLENSSPSSLRGGGSATIISREWMRESDSLIFANTTGTYFAFGPEYNQIRLTVIDDEGRSNYIIHTISGKHSVPKWREIPPFI